MADNYIVVGQFRFVDDTKSAIQKLRKAGFEELSVYSPLPNHDLEDELYKDRKRSPIRRCTLIGGLIGCLGAFLFTSWMSIDWPLRTSAKSLISVPAFVIIAFECTILIGAIFTLLGMLFFSRIPNVSRPGGFSGKFTEGTFGVAVRVAKESTENVKSLLQGCGAEHVEEEYAR